jgi:diguanylate cyclase (GGDEF)-like protein
MVTAALLSSENTQLVVLWFDLSVALVYGFLSLGMSRMYGSKVPSYLIIILCTVYFLTDTFNNAQGPIVGYTFGFLQTLYCILIVIFYPRKNNADIVLSLIMTFWLILNVLSIFSLKLDIIDTYYSDQLGQLFIFLPAYICGLTVFILGSYLINAKNELYSLATTDPMTGLFNRRYLFDQARTLFKVSDRALFPMTTIICDIDKFKLINDTYGHEVGDKVIIAFGEILASHVREIDVVARIGGEEFVLLLIKTDFIGASELAERLRNATEKLQVECDGMSVNFTASFGVAKVDTQLPFADSIKQADNALYQAKETGRNKVCVSTETPT